MVPAFVVRLSGCLTAPYVLSVLLMSSVLVNLLQCLALSLPRLIGWNSTRRLALSQQISNTFWNLLLFAVERWSCVPYRLTGDLVPLSCSALLIGNHCAGLDFISGIAMSSLCPAVGCGRMMTLMKSSLQWLPIVGWTHSLQGSLFLSRNWAQDQSSFARKLQQMRDGEFPRPFWAASYPEGKFRLNIMRRQLFAE